MQYSQAASLLLEETPRKGEATLMRHHSVSTTQGRPWQAAPSLRIPVISYCCLHILCVLG